MRERPSKEVWLMREKIGDYTSGESIEQWKKVEDHWCRNKVHQKHEGASW